jgi:tetratricopeptide (TPR) repeat protein
MGACTKKECADMSNIRNYSLNEQYQEIIDNYSGCKWNEIEDPRVIIDYIHAHAKLDVKLPSHLYKESDRVSNMSDGIYYLYNGQLNQSKDHVMNIQKSLEDTLWFTVAMLEYSSYSGNMTIYIDNLERLKFFEDSNQIHIPKYILPYYQGYYYAYVGDYENLDVLLKENGNDLYPYDKRVFLFKKAIYQNDLQLAGKIIDAQLSEYPHDQTSHEMKASLLYYLNGPSAAIKYLKEIISGNRKTNYLKYIYAEYLMIAGHITEGVERLNELCKEGFCKGVDGLYVLDLLITNNNNKSKALLRRLSSNNSLYWLPYFHYLYAKVQYASGNTDKAVVSLTKAKEMNPYADYIHWLECDISMAAQEYENAEASLMKLYALHPNDVNLLMELINYYDKIGEQKQSAMYKNKLMQSPRYIPEELNDQ